jgi:hypothetical protein
MMIDDAQGWDTWLGGTTNDAMALQRPLPNELLRIVASGEKSGATRGNDPKRGHEIPFNSLAVAALNRDKCQHTIKREL